MRFVREYSVNMNRRVGAKAKALHMLFLAATLIVLDSTNVRVALTAYQKPVDGILLRPSVIQVGVRIGEDPIGDAANPVALPVAQGQLVAQGQAANPAAASQKLPMFGITMFGSLRKQTEIYDELKAMLLNQRIRNARKSRSNRVSILRDFGVDPKYYGTSMLGRLNETSLKNSELIPFDLFDPKLLDERFPINDPELLDFIGVLEQQSKRIDPSSCTNFELVGAGFHSSTKIWKAKGDLQDVKKLGHKQFYDFRVVSSSSTTIKSRRLRSVLDGKTLQWGDLLLFERVQGFSNHPKVLVIRLTEIESTIDFRQYVQKALNDKFKKAIDHQDELNKYKLDEDIERSVSNEGYVVARVDKNKVENLRESNDLYTLEVSQSNSSSIEGTDVNIWESLVRKAPDNTFSGKNRLGIVLKLHPTLDYGFGKGDIIFGEDGDKVLVFKQRWYKDLVRKRSFHKALRWALTPGIDLILNRTDEAITAEVGKPDEVIAAEAIGKPDEAIAAHVAKPVRVSKAAPKEEYYRPSIGGGDFDKYYDSNDPRTWSIGLENDPVVIKLMVERYPRQQKWQEKLKHYNKTHMNQIRIGPESSNSSAGSNERGPNPAGTGLGIHSLGLGSGKRPGNY